MILDINSKYFSKQKVFVIENLDVSFEVEAEFYVFFTWISWFKESVSVYRMKGLVQNIEARFMDYEK
jgi:hypothetical protein